MECNLKLLVVVLVTISTWHAAASINDGADVATPGQSATAISDETEEECDLCQQKRMLQSLSDDDIKSVQLEQIKNVILDKLRMERAPNISREASEHLRKSYRHVIHTVMKQRKHQHKEEEHEKYVEEYYAKSQEVIRFADSVHICQDDPAAICMEFNVGKGLDLQEINSAILHLYFHRWWSYNNVAKITIFDETLTSTQGEAVYYYLEEKLHTYSKWDTIKVTKSAVLWAGKGISVAKFRVTCKNCAWNEIIRLRNGLLSKGPHLELQVAQRSRSKRSALQCSSDTTECCVQELYVSFAEIGWNWVIDPPGYSPNMCRGSCTNRFRLAYEHSRVIMAKTQPLTGGGSQGAPVSGSGRQNIDFNPCCSPTQLSSLDLMFVDDNGNVRSDTLPNMIVNACGCS